MKLRLVNGSIVDVDFSGQRLINGSIVEGQGGGGDTEAPVLSSPTGTKTGSTTATGNVTSANDANGTVYRYTSTSGTAPSIAHHKDGTGASAFASQTVTATGLQTFSAITGLDPSTTYYNHFLHTDAASNDSLQVVSTSFTTDAASGIPLAVLKNANRVIQAYLC